MAYYPRRSTKIHGHFLESSWDSYSRGYHIILDAVVIFELSDPSSYLGRFFLSLCDRIFDLTAKRLDVFYSHGGFFYYDIPLSFRDLHFNGPDYQSRTCRLWRSAWRSQKSVR